MAQASIPVDLFNPGQAFACLGFMEVADRLLGNARSGFDWQADSPRFMLSAGGEYNPFQAVLEFLSTCAVTAVAPPDEAATAKKLTTEKWGVPTTPSEAGAPYPFPCPDSPATLPARLTGVFQDKTIRLDIDHWGDDAQRTRRDNVKFWAGAGGYPGAALFRDALNEVRDQLIENAADPFALSCPQSSSFRLDWRRDYIPLDAGFSPNLHGHVVMVGYPIVEMLGVIGLTHARPRKTERNKLEYRYRILGVHRPDTLHAPLFLRAALGGADLGFPHRDFLMQLGWPGQENQARCITNVIEETEE